MLSYSWDNKLLDEWSPLTMITVRGRKLAHDKIVKLMKLPTVLLAATYCLIFEALLQIPISYALPMHPSNPLRSSKWLSRIYLKLFTLVYKWIKIFHIFPFPSPPFKYLQFKASAKQLKLLKWHFLYFQGMRAVIWKENHRASERPL